MAVHLHEGIYYIDACINGRRFRRSAHPSDYQDAVQVENELRGAAEPKLSHKRPVTGRVRGEDWELRRLMIPRAVKFYLKGRNGKIAPSSLDRERYSTIPIMKFFADKRCMDIGQNEIDDYQNARLAEGIQPVTINFETGTLARVIKRCGGDELKYEKLREEQKPFRAMTADEKQKFFELAASRPSWRNAYLLGLLASSTTMRSCEIKGLRWGDVDFQAGLIFVGKSKTEAGQRVIPMNEDARYALEELRQDEPGGDEEPVSQVTCWRSAWEALRAAAGMPGLHFHHLRHQAITELAEGGSSDTTIRAIAGHVSRRMLEYYSHTRLEAKRDAVAGIGSVR